MKKISLRDMPTKKKMVLLLFCLVIAVIILVFEHREDAVAPTVQEEVDLELSVGREQVAAANEDFFSTYRAQREAERSEEEELYAAVYRDTSLTVDERRLAKEGLEALYRRSALENKVETILKGRHYEDVVFCYQNPLSLLIIKGETLGAGEEESLAAFVQAYCGVEPGHLAVFTAQ